MDKNISVNPLLNWDSFCEHFLKEVNTSEIKFNIEDITITSRLSMKITTVINM